MNLLQEFLLRFTQMFVFLFFSISSMFSLESNYFCLSEITSDILLGFLQLVPPSILSVVPSEIKWRVPSGIFFKSFSRIVLRNSSRAHSANFLEVLETPQEAPISAGIPPAVPSVNLLESSFWKYSSCFHESFKNFLSESSRSFFHELSCGSISSRLREFTWSLFSVNKPMSSWRIPEANPRKIPTRIST